MKRLRYTLYRISDLEPDKISEIMETVSTKTRDAFEEVRNSLRLDGYKQGIKQTAINKGYSDTQIAEITNLNISQNQKLREENLH